MLRIFPKTVEIKVAAYFGTCLVSAHASFIPLPRCPTTQLSRGLGVLGARVTETQLRSSDDPLSCAALGKGSCLERALGAAGFDGVVAVMTC